MKQGTVKWFNAQKGYGFITADEGVDYFVHYASINVDGFKTLAEGQRVTFEESKSEKGLEAREVTLVACYDKHMPRLAQRLR